MVKSQGYYLREDWLADLHMVTLHRGDCPQCLNGRVSAVHSPARGKWHGPLETERHAAAASSGLSGVTVRTICHCLKTLKDDNHG